MLPQQLIYRNINSDFAFLIKIIFQNLINIFNIINPTFIA